MPMDRHSHGVQLVDPALLALLSPVLGAAATDAPIERGMEVGLAADRADAHVHGYLAAAGEISRFRPEYPLSKDYRHVVPEFWRNRSMGFLSIEMQIIIIIV